MSIQNLLEKKYKFTFQLKGWKVALITLSFVYIPYIAWELFWYSKVGDVAIKWHTWFAAIFFLIVLLLIPEKPFTYLKRFYFLFILYVGLSLAIGEVHPFTKVPMYSSFQSKITIFSLQNTSGNLMPFEKYSKLSSGPVMHKYFNAVETFSTNNTQQEAKKLAVKYIEAELNLHTPSINNIYLCKNEIYIAKDSIRINSVKITKDE